MPRAGLDAGVVARRASALIDEHGLDALTLARVAGELGVATPSLYKHVAGLDDLITRVAVEATTELAAQLSRATRGLSGREALQAIAEAYRRFAREHPGTYPLTQRHLTTPEWRSAAAEAVTAVVVGLSGYGLTERDVDQIRYVRAALHGFTDLERGGGFGLPASVEASFGYLVAGLHVVLSGDAAPSNDPAVSNDPAAGSENVSQQ